jgi:hypothetical protein
MIVKYYSVSNLNQTANRFELHQTKYDYIFIDKVSKTIPFNDGPEAKNLFYSLNEGK